MMGVFKRGEIPNHYLLALGLGRSLGSLENSKVSPKAGTMSSERGNIKESVIVTDCVGNENRYSLKKLIVGSHKLSGTGAKLDLQLGLSSGPAESVVTDITPVSDQHHSSPKTSFVSSAPIIDEEGSEPYPRLFGTYLAPSLHATEVGGNTIAISMQLLPTPNRNVESSVACTSGVIHREKHNGGTKNCQYQGCVKGARGASGLCIAHGGGRRCQKPGCHKGAEGRTIYCKGHGGGRRCQYLGCTKSAEGRTDFCIAHGGGCRCTHEGCKRAARGKSGLCIRHGGGKRCQMESCARSAEGSSGLCISHGGGRRCQFPECPNGAQGSTMFCKAHGGGRRCTFLGCIKGAEGSTPFCKRHGGGKRCSFEGGGVCPRSVHGGTQFCVAHGGGKRCAAAGCTRSARGRTNFCVRHGGGKRCKFEGCDKSAQGSTDLCKAHGGGNRCSWGREGSGIGIGCLPCEKYALSKTSLCNAHTALVQDSCVRGGGNLGPLVSQALAAIEAEKMKGVASEGFVEWGAFDTKKAVHPPVPVESDLPEGRVHGGSLIAVLSGNADLGRNCRRRVDAGASVDGASSSAIPYTWM